MNTVEYYNMLSIISAFISVLLTVMAVVMWLKLDVRHYLAVLSGSEAKRSIDKIKKDAESGAVQADLKRRNNKAVITWNTSEGLEDAYDLRNRGTKDGTMLLGAGTPKARAVYEDPNKTMVLATAQEYATTVLDRIQDTMPRPESAPVMPQMTENPQMPQAVQMSQTPQMPQNPQASQMSQMQTAPEISVEAGKPETAPFKRKARAIQPSSAPVADRILPTPQPVREPSPGFVIEKEIINKENK